MRLRLLAICLLVSAGAAQSARGSRTSVTAPPPYALLEQGDALLLTALAEGIPVKDFLRLVSRVAGCTFTYEEAVVLLQNEAPEVLVEVVRPLLEAMVGVHVTAHAAPPSLRVVGPGRSVDELVSLLESLDDLARHR